MSRAALFLITFLAACSSAERRRERDLEARRECVRELNAEAIRRGEDFVELGIRKEAEAAAIPDEPARFRALRCALAAFEAATVVEPADPLPFLGAARAYAALGQGNAAAEMYRLALARKPAPALREEAEAWLRGHGG